MSTTHIDAARDLFGPLDRAAAATPPGEPMPRASLDAIVDGGLLGLMVPRAVGGQELPLADIVDVYEEVSRADGSTGWCYFAADCTAAYFGAYLPDAGAESVFADGIPLMAGQFAPNGTATFDGDELVIDGDYQFGSGIAHAAWAGAGVLTAADEGANPDYLFACFPVDQAELRGQLGRPRAPGDRQLRLRAPRRARAPGAGVRLLRADRAPRRSRVCPRASSR